MKNLIPERGFIDPGGRTEGIIDARNWHKFVRSPSSAVISIVREFYANASEPRGDSVFVRGKWVSFSPSTINSLFDLVDYDVDEYAVFVNKPTDFNYILKYLCGPDTTVRWKTKDNSVTNFPASGLSPESKAWHYFVSAKLLPSGNVSEVTRDRAVLNFCIQNCLTINVGRIISRSINNTLTTHASVALGHPSLIHELCVSQGVTFFPSEEFLHTKTPISKSKISSYSARYYEQGEGSSSRPRVSPSKMTLSDQVGRLNEKVERQGKAIECVQRDVRRVVDRQARQYQYMNAFNTSMVNMFENCSLNIGPRHVDFPTPPNLYEDEDEEEEEEDEEEEDDDEEDY